jgi:methyl-accepting chemotaxis protein
MKLGFAVRRPSFHLGLRSQIMMLGLAGVAIIGTFYLLGRQFEDDSRRTAEKFGALTSLTSKLSENLLQARQIATEFLQKPDEKKTALHNQIIAAAAGYLAEIEPMAEALPAGDPLRQATAFRSGINMYTTRFSNVVSAQRLIGFNENDGLQGKLRTAVHSVEERLKQFDQPRLAVLMLMMRRHEKDFMLRGDEKYGDELDKRSDEFAIELAKTDLPASTKTEITTLIKAYRSSFIAYMAGQTTLSEEAADLAQIYERLRPTLSAVRKAADEHLETVRAMDKATQQAIFWAICVTMATVAIAALLFGRWLSTPLVKMAAAMQDLAQGNIDAPIARFERRDEIGVISRALSVFHEKLLENRQLTADQVKSQEQSVVERKAAMLQIANGFEHTVGKIIEIVSSASSEIELAAGSLTKTAEVTQGLSATVAAASGQSSANVQSAAAASEEMASSVAKIGRQVQKSHTIAHAAVQQAEQTNARISELSQSAGRIGEVIKIITAVAEQTNLLALNATIEAARAGEAGRGFAVVASEVKALAAQTAKAADEIGTQIAQMQTATQHSVSAIGEIGGTIAQISEIASAIAAAVEQQGATTQEIARNVQQAAQGATQVASSIVDVNRGATDTGTAAGQVHTLASSLVSESNHLKIEVETFLGTVRAA